MTIIVNPTIPYYYYTTKAPEYYTTSYATPSYFTEAPKYYTRKAAEYCTTTYAAPVLLGVVRRGGVILRGLSVVSGLTVVRPSGFSVVSRSYVVLGCFCFGVVSSGSSSWGQHRRPSSLGASV
ncbi:hypothetical protein OUZ56_016551 [Daphnia magna]|uniref:Uncharacterized protein n=1 Tax=Daphnia magna TaxID=35525 RepID=A0ABR0AQZ3_9CRUS|nr:hypothetical protein OUZ56_016551 [Daphnia magna]